MEGDILPREPARSGSPSVMYPEGAVIDLTGLPITGASDAEVVLIEFSDYGCPFCIRHASSVKKQLWETYVSTGQIRYAFANNPLPIHPKAAFMATAAICAGEQDLFWEMHDRLFEVLVTTTSEATALLENMAFPALVLVSGLWSEVQPTTVEVNRIDKVLLISERRKTAEHPRHVVMPLPESASN